MANGGGRRWDSVSRTGRDQQWRDHDEADEEEAEGGGDECEARVLRLSAARAARPPRSMVASADDDEDDDDDEDEDDADDADDEDDEDEDVDDDDDDDEDDEDDEDDDDDDDDGDEDADADEEADLEAEELADTRRRRCGRGGNTQTQTHHAGFSVRQTMTTKDTEEKKIRHFPKAIHPAKRTHFAFHR